MTRLTNDARKKITRMILAHKFDPLYKQLERERKSLGKTVYEGQYADLKARLEGLQEATRGKAFPTRSAFTVNAGGWNVRLELEAERPFLHAHEQRWHGDSEPVWSYDEQHELTPLIRSYATRMKETKDEEKHLEEQVSGQLVAHFTFDKLSAAWPEIDRFVRAVERGLPAPSTVPALADHKALNTALDLPPEDTEE